jgi:uncharacterized protein (TIGR02147 family)
MISVFDFNDYRKYLLSALPTEGVGRGSRNRLAEQLNCQKGFVSQVLSGRSHFSLEHGMKVCRFLNLDPQEEEYFILLLHRERAGSKDLEKFYNKKIFEITQRRKQINERIQSSSILSEADQMTYYSSWHYIAVHMCLMIPELRTRNAISAHLGVTSTNISKVLDFLLRTGYAEKKGDEYIAGPTRSHLPEYSPLIAKHHTNWRIRAIESLDSVRDTDMHYSLVMSISDETAEKIKEILLNTIQKIEPELKLAQDKEAFVLNFDLFNLKKTT